MSFFLFRVRVNASFKTARQLSVIRRGAALNADISTAPARRHAVQRLELHRRVGRGQRRQARFQGRAPRTHRGGHAMPRSPYGALWLAPLVTASVSRGAAGWDGSALFMREKPGPLASRTPPHGMHAPVSEASIHSRKRASPAPNIGLQALGDGWTAFLPDLRRGGHPDIHAVPPPVSVNARCIEGIDLATLTIRQFDGKNLIPAQHSHARPAIGFVFSISVR